VIQYPISNFEFPVSTYSWDFIVFQKLDTKFKFLTYEDGSCIDFMQTVIESNEIRPKRIVVQSAGGLN
jgi:hypothetical protein